MYDDIDDCMLGEARRPVGCVRGRGREAARHRLGAVLAACVLAACMGVAPDLSLASASAGEVGTAAAAQAGDGTAGAAVVQVSDAATSDGSAAGEAAGGSVMPGAIDAAATSASASTSTAPSASDAVATGGVAGVHTAPGSPDAAAQAGDTSVAAYVNGEALPTSTLTDYIDAERANIGSSTNAAWEAYLADRGYTPDGYWSALISHYAREMVLTQRADELGLQVGDDEVDARIAQIKQSLGVDGDDSAFLWDAYLDTYGFTEESLRANQAYYLLRDKLYASEVEMPVVDDAFVQLFADTYGGLYGIEVGQDGTADLSGLDDDTLARLREGAEDFAWQSACDMYADGLLAQADVQVVVAHQYDVPGQDHDAQ